MSKQSIISAYKTMHQLHNWVLLQTQESYRIPGISENVLLGTQQFFIQKLQVFVVLSLELLLILPSPVFGSVLGVLNTPISPSTPHLPPILNTSHELWTHESGHKPFHLPLLVNILIPLQEISLPLLMPQKCRKRHHAEIPVCIYNLQSGEIYMSCGIVGEPVEGL